MRKNNESLFQQMQEDAWRVLSCNNNPRDSSWLPRPAPQAHTGSSPKHSNKRRKLSDQRILT